MTRKFEDKPATRERVPMLVGLVGPSGSGKTYSALRLATGMQRITGGDIFFVDTESRRALHYADDFSFRHTDMGAPFSSLDYMAAIEHCSKKKAGVLVIDSMSHEHEGPGGYLDFHESELDRMAGDDYKKRQKMSIPAWAKPSADRRKLINAVLRMGVNAVFCFRAKEKLKIVTGRDPIKLGWQPIAGNEFIYEMTINCLLYPGAVGVPNWAPDEAGEKVMLKRPEKLAHVFKDGQAISEDTGEALARWAEGESAESTPNAQLEEAVSQIRGALTTDQLNAAMKRWAPEEWSPSEKATLREAAEATRECITESAEERGEG